MEQHFGPPPHVDRFTWGPPSPQGCFLPVELKMATPKVQLFPQSRPSNHHCPYGQWFSGSDRQRPKQQPVWRAQAKPSSQEYSQVLQIEKRRLDSASRAGSGKGTERRDGRVGDLEVKGMDSCSPSIPHGRPCGQSKSASSRLNSAAIAVRKAWPTLRLRQVRQ